MELQDNPQLCTCHLDANTGMHKAKEIRARISRRLDLWESVSRSRLVGETEANKEAREGMVAREEGEEEGKVR